VTDGPDPSLPAPAPGGPVPALDGERPLRVLLDDLPSLLGKHLGYSDWHPVDQDLIDRFAALTGDRQWIHVNPWRARKGPFGATVVPGFLTLSLFTPLLSEVVVVEGAQLVVNYGLNRVRFPSPLVAGARVRLGIVLRAVDPVPGGVQAGLQATFESDRAAKPCCVADVIFRYYVALPP
jgi:acyl dehydratase